MKLRDLRGTLVRAYRTAWQEYLRPYEISDVSIAHPSRGWRVQLWGRCASNRQFSWESVHVEDAHRFLPVALWKTWRLFVNAARFRRHASPDTGHIVEGAEVSLRGVDGPWVAWGQDYTGRYLVPLPQGAPDGEPWRLGARGRLIQRDSRNPESWEFQPY